MEEEEPHGPVSELEKTNANVVEKSDENVTKKLDENVTEKLDENVTEKSYENVTNNATPTTGCEGTNIDDAEMINESDLAEIRQKEMREIILNSDMVEIVVFDSPDTTPEKISFPESENEENKIEMDIEMVNTEVDGSEERKTGDEPSGKAVEETPLESLEEDPLELQKDSEKEQDIDPNESVDDADNESPETGDKEQRTVLKRELQSLLDSAKNSKIISSFTQNTSKVRKSRKDLDNSAASNVSLEFEKNVRSRRSSITSNLSNSSANSDKGTKRSMRSQNPDFMVKHRRFLSSVVGKKSEIECIGITSDEETNDEADPTTGKNGTTAGESTPDCSLQTSPVQEDSRRKMLRGLSDPYCWRCHHEVATTTANPRSAINCSTCVRSYHVKCLGTSWNGVSYQVSDIWTCPECLAIQNAENLETRSPAMKKVTLPVMCDLLRYALKRLMDLPGIEPFTHGVDLIRFPEYPRFVVRPMDLVKMKRNVASSEYASTQAFLADAKFILHNSIVFNTQQSRLTNLAKSLIRTAKLEMSEIEACPQCYSAANTRQMTWFTDVCDPPHMLLWAKLKGFPFWPAKAMSVNVSSGSVDARFFGAHDRAWVQLKDCFLYSSKDPNLIVRTKRQDINESVREAEQHIRNITRKFGVFVHAPFKTLYEPARQQEQLRMMIPSYQSPIPLQPVSKESELKSLRPYPVIPRRNSLPSFNTRSPKTPKSGTSSILGYGTDDDENVTKDTRKSRKMADGASIAAEDETLDSPMKDESSSPNDSLKTSTPKEVTRKRSYNELQEANEFSIFRTKKYKTQLKNCSVRIEILEESDEECKKRGIKSMRKIDVPQNEKKSEVVRKQSEKDNKMKDVEVIDQSEEQSHQSEVTEEHKATHDIEQTKRVEETEKVEKSKVIDQSANVLQSLNGEQLKNGVAEPIKEIASVENIVDSSQKLNDHSKKETEVATVTSDDNLMPKITRIHSLADKTEEYMIRNNDEESSVIQISCEASPEKPKSPEPKSTTPKNPPSNIIKEKSPITSTVKPKTTKKSPVKNDVKQRSSLPNTLKHKSPGLNPTVPKISISNLLAQKTAAMRQTQNTSNSLTNSNVFKVTKPKEPIVANMKEAMERLKQLREEVASERVNRKVGTIEVRSFAKTGIDNPPYSCPGNTKNNTSKTTEEILSSQPENTTNESKSPNSTEMMEIEIKTEPINVEFGNEQRTVEKNNLLGSLQLAPTSRAQTNITKPQNNTISRTPDVRTMSNYKIPVTIIRKESNVTKPKPRQRRPAQKAISQKSKAAASTMGANSCVNTNTTSSNGQMGSQFPMVYIPPSAMADLAKQSSQKNVSTTNVSTNLGTGSTSDNDYVMSTLDSTGQNYTICNVNNAGPATLMANSVTVSSADTPLLCAGINQSGTQSAPQQMPSILQGLVSSGQPYSIQAIPMATTINNGLTPFILSFQQTQTMRSNNTNMGMPPLVDINNPDSSTDSANSISLRHEGLNNLSLIQPNPSNVGQNSQCLNIVSQPWSSGSTIAVNVATAGSNLVVNGPLPDLTSMDPQSAATLTQGLVTALSNVMGKQIPPVQTQPIFSGNPLDPSNPPYPSTSSTGIVHKMLNEQAVKLADHFRRALEECLSSLSSQGSPEATIRSLQLQLEKSEARHKDQIAKLKQSTESLLTEAKQTFLKDIQQVRREGRINADTERIIAINETKKKQWCANCWREAQFYCCWNTSYCNYPCQQAHWPAHFSACTQDTNTAQQESGVVKKLTPQIQFIRRVGGQQDHSNDNGISGSPTFTVQRRLVPRAYQGRRPQAPGPLLTVAQGAVSQTPPPPLPSAPVSGGGMRLTAPAPSPIRYSQPYFLNKLQVNSESVSTNKTTSNLIQKGVLPSKPTTPRPFTPNITTTAKTDP